MIDYNLLKDESLISNIKNQNDTEKSLKVLIERHSGLCIDMINSYVSKDKNESLRIELIKEKDYQIYVSALRYDPNRGSKFSTYLGNEIKWKCLNIHNKNKRHKSIPVEENLIDYFSYLSKDKDTDTDTDKKNDIFNSVIEYTKNYPDERIGKIFNLRYVVGKNNSVMPWKYISKEIGMSIQGCINLHNSTLKKIKTKIRKD
jgi:DNA-directed RNA polymerase specialized sigma subunit